MCNKSPRIAEGPRFGELATDFINTAHLCSGVTNLLEPNELNLSWGTQNV